MDKRLVDLTPEEWVAERAYRAAERLAFEQSIVEYNTRFDVITDPLARTLARLHEFNSYGAYAHYCEGCAAETSETAPFPCSTITVIAEHHAIDLTLPKELT